MSAQTSAVTTARTTTGTTAPLASTDTEFVVDRSASVMEVKLDWPTPDDFDLEVYRRNADGSLTQVGSSGNLPGEKERVLLQDPALGTYVLRVVNYAAVSPTWTLTAALFDATTTSTSGLVEAWTLTCEQGGRVLQTVPIVIERGQQVKADLRVCATAAQRG